MERYGVIHEKQPREIVLLRGKGCVYRKCAFCDYHTDRCSDENENFALNRQVLSRVTGKYGDLEVINSGSVFELDGKTMALILEICKQKGISVLHFESHFLYRDRISALRREFSGISLKMKLGLETFDFDFRENFLHKGIPLRDPEEICRDFEEANFLFGLRGQTENSMRRDLVLGLSYFERICVNLMCKNSTPVFPDLAVITVFKEKIYPEIKDNPRVDVLLKNTDFGVGN